jgi:tetratricopeptide (TPR) repeat protein
MRRDNTFQWLAQLLLVAGAAGIAPKVQAHGAYHDVVAEITRQLALNPEDAALHFKLASAHLEHGEWKEALIEAERTERLQSQRFDTGYIQGAALAAGGHLEAAKSVVNAFLSRQPMHQAALTERARLLMKLGEPDEALVDYEQVWSQAKPEIMIEAAKAFESAGRREEALHMLRVLREPDPSVWSLRLGMELAGEHFDAALSCLPALQKQAPRPEPWMARRAEILTLAQRHAEARTAWNDLHQHLLALPSLERGTPLLAGLLTQAQQALGTPTLTPVIAPPQP